MVILFLPCQACALTSLDIDHKASFYQESDISSVGTQFTCAVFVIRLQELSQHWRLKEFSSQKV
jgi:hypothetical protein